ncbi:Ig-like domain-containing protein [uncultured Marinobacter sp.]|uniref:Ig-like domain-containing protein n=1 Tax=uncultured Marinobacter sp. TaxID=187379 RepID=UPI0030DB2D32
MTGKYFARATALSLAFFLAACGGDENSTPLAGGGGGTGGDGGGVEEAQVGSLTLLTDRPQIGSSGSGSATITALVQDSNGVVMDSTPVSFSRTGGGSLIVQDPVTNSEGRAEARLNAGTDPSNRTITVSASAGNRTASVDVRVSGTSLALTGSESIALTDSAPYSARLTNSEDSAIAGVPVTISSSLGNQINAGSLTTDDAGLVRFNLNATIGGTDNVRAEAYSGESLISAEVPVQISTDNFAFTAPASGGEVELGEQANVSVLWESNGAPIADGSIVVFSTTRGSFTPANGSVATSNGVAQVTISSDNVGPATVTAVGSDGGPSSQRQLLFVSSTPDTVSVQADRTQIGTNSSTTVTATVLDVNNNLVKNATVRFELDDITGGELSNGTAITNEQGRAQTTYTSSSTTSRTDGVVITARVNESITNSVGLTVGGNALRINIGTGNEIDDSNLTRYQAPWSVFVTDSNGNAVSGKAVNISVIPTRFFKGRFVRVEGGNPDFQPIKVATCLSEDTDNNGVFTEAKDTNQNKRLDPIPSATVPNAITTGVDGTADFTLTYPKSECEWVLQRQA